VPVRIGQEGIDDGVLSRAGTEDEDPHDSRLAG
jgi:hypothetical protein